MGPLVNIFYKYVRATLSEAFWRETAVDARQSPLFSVVMGSAPVRRGTNFARLTERDAA